MAVNYDPSTSAILLVDPYNDFLSEGGKLVGRRHELRSDRVLDILGQQ